MTKAKKFFMKKLFGPKVSRAIWHEFKERPVMLDLIGEIMEEWHSHRLNMATDETMKQNAQVFASGNLIPTTTKQEQAKHVFHCYEWGWKECLMELRRKNTEEMGN